MWWSKEFREDESTKKNKDKHAKHILGVFWMGKRDRIGGICFCVSRCLFSKLESSSLCCWVGVCKFGHCMADWGLEVIAEAGEERI